MTSDDAEPDKTPDSRDPDRPAYDNPARNKGELAAGHNAPERPRPPPSSAPQGHPSDQKLGRKPARRG